MKPELILHIGLPKTGTTSIQHTLAHYRAALLELGVSYPLSPGRSNHALLPASILGEAIDLRHFDPSLWEGVTPALRTARFRREFDEEMSGLPDTVSKVLISAEHCSGFLNTRDEVAALEAFLRPYFRSIRIVAYLRRQDLHEASIYNQRLRIGELTKPHLPPNTPEQLPTHNYAAMMDIWASVFGDDAIAVRIFERQSLLNGDVIDDFLAVCGVALEVPADDPRRNMNTSSNLVGQRLMVQAGRRLVETRGQQAMRSATWRQMTRVCCDVLSGTGWLPTRDEAKEFMSRFAPGNEAVRARFRPDRKTLFSEDYDRLPEAPVELETGTLLAAAFDVLLYQIEQEARTIAGHYMRQARLHVQLADHDSAKDCWRQAIRHDPMLVPARVALAHALLREGDIGGAQEHARVAQEVAPDSVPVQTLLARLARMTAAQKGPVAAPVEAQMSGPVAE